MNTTRTKTRTRWPEPFGPALRFQRQPGQTEPRERHTCHDFFVINPRPDLLEPEPRARFRPYSIDLP